MRILITGAGGRLGSLLRAAYVQLGTVSDDIVFQSRVPGCDVTWSPSDPLGALPECDAVAALWGQTSGDVSALAENVALVSVTRAVALNCNAKRVFHISSAAVYGAGVRMSEAWPTAPLGSYGQSKLEMEQAVVDAPLIGVEECCLRLANVVGADSLAPGLQGEGPVKLDRFADGHGPLRSYIAASDLLAVIRALVSFSGVLPPILNVAAPFGVAMQALVQAAGKDVVWCPAPETAVQEVTLDVTRLTRLLPQTLILSDAQDMIADWQRLEGLG